MKIIGEFTFAKRYFNIAEKTERVATCGSFYFYKN